MLSIKICCPWQSVLAPHLWNEVYFLCRCHNREAPFLSNSHDLHLVLYIEVCWPWQTALSWLAIRYQNIATQLAMLTHIFPGVWIQVSMKKSYDLLLDHNLFDKNLAFLSLVRLVVSFYCAHDFSYHLYITSAFDCIFIVLILCLFMWHWPLVQLPLWELTILSSLFAVFHLECIHVCLD